MFWTTQIQKGVLILIGVASLSLILVFLLAPKDNTNYTVTDTEYWSNTGNRLMLKTAYDYNNKDDIQSFPKVFGDWQSFDYKYPDYVYTNLNADMLMTRGYIRNNGDIVWMDIINSNAGQSFHKQNICVEGAGWTVDNDSIAEFTIADSSSSNPFTKLYTNRLDLSKKDEKQVMIYWFMYKKFGSKDAATMIRLSAPVNNNTEHTFNSIKEFVEGQLFGVMYKGTEKEEITTAEYVSKEYGNKGLMAMIIGLLTPIGIIITGIRKKDG